MKAFPALIVLLVLVAGCASQREQAARPGEGVPRPMLFASPMGEPFRGPGGEERWFAGADANGDGKLTATEMAKDAERFFATLDIEKDGEIDPDDMQRYENEIFPEIRVGGVGTGGRQGAGARRRGGGGGGGGGGGRRGGGGQGGVGRADQKSVASMGRRGAGRFSYLDIPQPIAGADSNLNRGVSLAELAAASGQRFELLDVNHDGYLTLAELPEIRRRRRPS